MSDPGRGTARGDWTARVQRLCDQILAASAGEVDLSGAVPEANLRRLASDGFAGVTTPESFGGNPLDAVDLWRLHERIAGACGNTWFVLVQHLGACSQMASTPNTELRDQWLGTMASGERWVGVAFGHLRRPNPPVSAIPVRGGWEITGTAPWVTGWPLLSHCIAGARLPDGENLFVLVPLEEPESVRVSDPLALSAMSSTGTVAVEFRRTWVPDSSLLRIASPGEMAEGDRSNLLKTTAPLLGLASSAVATARQELDQRPVPSGHDALDQLDDQRQALRVRILTELAGGPSRIDVDLHGALRAQAIDLAQTCAHAAAIASAGAANSIRHPAQRHVREAVFYSVFQHTSAIASATLHRLASSRPV